MIEFEALPDHGLKVVDELDRWSFIIDSDDILTPRPCETSDFPFPVDKAVSIEATELAYAEDYGLAVRDADGEFLANVFKEERTFPRDTYYIDVSTRSKSYLRVHDAEMTIATPDGRDSDPSVPITFDRPTRVDVGVRSGHSRPIGTITTTDDPRDMMRAISYLGSSLKELSCERSWPTLRGHPPRIERGNTFRIPRELEMPETGITIEVPARYETVYPIAPLAFYMGATVVEGETARLRTETGFTYDFEGDDLGRSAYRVLKHCLTLDSLVRNGGYFEYDSYEAMQLANQGLNLDTERLYNAPIAEQVEAYLSIPLEDVQSNLPTSGTEATLRPTPEDVTFLPFLASELHCIRVPETSVPDTTPEQTTGGLRNTLRRAARHVTGHLQSPFENQSNPAESGILYDNGLTTHRATSVQSNIPMGVTQLVPEAYMNQIRRKPLEDGEFAVAVVCNDDAMWEEVEQATQEYVGDTSEGRALAVDIKRNLTTDELATVLMGEYQFFHYVGHTSSDGFVCTDGALDVRTLPYVGVEGFLLNACESHEQGLELIRKGSIGGIATLCKVVTNRAVELGARLAAMLNLGYPLGPAFDLSMRADPILTGQYRVIGNANVELRRMEGGDFLFSLYVDSSGADEHTITTKSYSSTHMSLGGIARSYSEEETNAAFLVGTDIRTQTLSTEELLEYLNSERCATFLTDGTFYWSDRVTESDVRDSLESNAE